MQSQVNEIYEASNLAKSQSFRTKKQNGLSNLTYNQSKDNNNNNNNDPPNTYTSSRESRNGSQHIQPSSRSSYLPLKIKMTPRTAENLKNQANQLRTQASFENNIINKDAQKGIARNDQQVDCQIQQEQQQKNTSNQIETMLDGMQQRRLTDAQIRQTRVNQLKSYIATAYSSETPARKNETPIRNSQKNPQQNNISNNTHYLSPNNTFVKYRVRQGQNERILPMKAPKNGADLNVHVQLPRYSPAPSLVEQIQAKSSEELFPGNEFNSRPGSEFNTRPGSEFASHLPLGGSTSTNTSSLLPFQSLQSKQLRDSLKKGEQEISVEEMHFYAVDFQQNCKQWMSRIENTSKP